LRTKIHTPPLCRWLGEKLDPSVYPDNEKAFTKWLPGMFPTPLLPLAKCIVAQGAVLKGM
jgi:hypothetical protein